MMIDNAAWLVLDRAQGDLEGQIYHAVRERILAGGLAAGDRLPSSRALALALGVARSTVMGGYDRLRAEGFLAAARGSATRVASLPAAPQGAPPQPAPSMPPLSAPEPERFLPFRPGLPDLDSFPAAIWARCLAARARALRVHDMGYGEEAGLAALREAIVEHVRRTRAVVADAGQVVILPSTAAALDLLVRLVPGEERPVWLEEPGYPTGQAVLRRAGARLVPVPCDAQGMDVARAMAMLRPGDPPPRLIYVTPSHQYPTGVAMTLARRLELLEAAAGCGAFVIEDDYDSEFHYAARPLAALQGIDRAGRVAYVGTFSKVLAPGLRVAYAILPPALLGPARAALRLLGGSVPVHVQAALADVLAEGHLRAHIRQMRETYRARMEATAQVLRRVAGGVLRVGAMEGGLQLPAWFAGGADDVAVARALHARGIGAMAISPFYLGGWGEDGAARPGLLFGIAGATPAALAALETALPPALGL